MIKNLLIFGLLVLNVQSWTVRKSVHGTYQDYDFNSNSQTSFKNFKNDFSCQAIPDPTNGNCDYIQGCTEFDQLVVLKNNKQLQLKLGSTLEGSCKQGSPSPCYPAIRIQSQDTYNANTLIVVKAQQIPSLCSLWPAFWMTATGNWPNEGELDIIEYINGNKQNSCTMHTNDGCSMQQFQSNAVFNGRSWWGNGSNGEAATNCYINAPNQYNNQGCSIVFNNIDYQGTYATEWVNINSQQTQVNVFYWNYGDDVTSNSGPLSNNPNPRNWNSYQYASFILNSSNCPTSHFKNANLIINTAICGDWAGSAFEQYCPNKGTCQDYLRSSEFQGLVSTDQATWIIDNIKIFE